MNLYTSQNFYLLKDTPIVQILKIMATGINIQFQLQNYSIKPQKIKKIKKVFGNLVLFNRFIKKAKAIQYLSEIEQKMSSDFKNDSFIMGNGIYTPSLKKEKFSENCIKLVYVGRYAVYHKGLDILLDGCKKAYKNMIINKIEVNLY